MSANDDFIHERGPVGPECFRGSDYPTPAEAPRLGEPCSDRLRLEGKPYGKPCRQCGLGPCSYHGPVDVEPASTTVQPPPAPSTGDVWLELIVAEPDEGLRQMYAERRAFGVAKYGTPLQRDNGRDAVADAVQEALDGMVYAQQAGHAEALGHFRAALLVLRGSP